MCEENGYPREPLTLGERLGVAFFALFVPVGLGFMKDPCGQKNGLTTGAMGEKGKIVGVTVFRTVTSILQRHLTVFVEQSPFGLRCPLATCIQHL